MSLAPPALSALRRPLATMVFLFPVRSSRLSSFFMSESLRPPAFAAAMTRLANLKNPPMNSIQEA